MRSHVWMIVALLALLGWQPGEVRAQQSATADSLREASFKAGMGRWAEAIDQCQRIIEVAGDDLVPIPVPVMPLAQLTGGAAFTVPWQSARSVPARWIAHEEIGRFPPAALKLYRERVDAAAARRFADVRGRADDRPLEQFLADWFNSRSGEDAILLLAQRAFERGEIEVAARCWRMLLPGRDGERRYPEPRTPPATLMARLILAQMFMGHAAQARREAQAFRAAFPEASGLLAGREGKYADTLDALLDDPRQTALPTPPGAGREWTTFAGRPSRDSAIAAGLPRYWPGPANWTVALPSLAQRKPLEEQPRDADHPRSLAFHPVIARGRAFVADGMHVYAFNLVNGKRTTVFDLSQFMAIPGIDLQLPVADDRRYTLTYADSFLYVRMGAERLRAHGGEADAPNESSSVIVCLGPILDGKDDNIPHAWTLRPPKGDKESTTIFEGTPLVRDGKLFALLWRQSGGAITTAVACYQTQGPDSPPELIWQAARPAGRVLTRPSTRAPGTICSPWPGRTSLMGPTRGASWPLRRGPASPPGNIATATTSAGRSPSAAT